MTGGGETTKYSFLPFVQGDMPACSARLSRGSSMVVMMIVRRLIHVGAKGSCISLRNGCTPRIEKLPVGYESLWLFRSGFHVRERVDGVPNLPS